MTSNFIELTEDTFFPFLEQHEYVLVAFVLPFLTERNDRLTIEYNKAAQITQAHGVALAQFDASQGGPVSAQFDFANFVDWPTIKLIIKGQEAKEYNGAWKASEIVTFVRRNCLPSPLRISKDDFDDYRKGHILILGFLPADGVQYQDVMEQVTSAVHENYLITTSDDADLAKQEGVNSPCIVIYRDDGSKYISTCPFQAHTLLPWIRMVTLPLVPEILPEAHKAYIKGGVPIGYLMIESNDQRSKYADMLEPIAKKYIGQIQIGTAHIDEFKWLPRDMHLDLRGKSPDNLHSYKDYELPVFAIREPKKNRRFLMELDQKPEQDLINQFIQQFLSTKLLPTIKSTSTPPDTGSTHVVEVIGTTYDNIVFDNDKDVLIEFYTPTCRPCKFMAPAYEELAKSYSRGLFSNKVTIAKTDASENDVPYEINSYPTLWLYPAGAKETPISYLGPLTAKDMAQFIERFGTHKASMGIKE